MGAGTARRGTAGGHEVVVDPGPVARARRRRRGGVAVEAPEPGSWSHGARTSRTWRCSLGWYRVQPVEPGLRRDQRRMRRPAHQAGAEGHPARRARAPAPAPRRSRRRSGRTRPCARRRGSGAPGAPSFSSRQARHRFAGLLVASGLFSPAVTRSSRVSGPAQVVERRGAAHPPGSPRRSRRTLLIFDSITVSGIMGSSIVLSMSTKRHLGDGRGEQPARRSSMCSTSSLLALAPRSAAALPRSRLPSRCSAQVTVSLKVCSFAASLPSSYQRRPSSPPPRTWAIA